MLLVKFISPVFFITLFVGAIHCQNDNPTTEPTKSKDTLHFNNEGSANYVSTSYRRTQNDSPKRSVSPHLARIKESKNNTWMRLGFYLSTSLALYFFILFQRKKKENEELKHLASKSEKELKYLNTNFNQALIKKQEEEKKRISKELHDHIGQELLLIKHGLEKGGNKITSKKIQYVIDGVREVSQNLNPVALERLGLKKALESMIDKVGKNTNLVVSHEIQNADNYFNDESSLNIYRIIQESLNNVLKHSDATALKVILITNTKETKIDVLDNGKGFDHDNTNLGLGLYSMKQRASILKGTLEITKVNHKGTRISIVIPKSSN